MTKRIIISQSLGSQTHSDIGLGGPGSGNWAHVGRPGFLGGSAPRNSGMTIAKGQDWLARQAAAKGKTVAKTDGAATMRASLATAEAEIHTLRHERCYAYTADGTPVLNKDGAKDYISFDDDEVALMKDTVFTHNHPGGWEFDDSDPRSVGNAFSKEDLLMACRGDVAEMRAVARKTTYVMRRPAKGWPEDLERVQRDLASMDRQVYDRTWPEISAKTISIAEAEARHANLVSQGFAQLIGAQYEIIRTG